MQTFTTNDSDSNECTYIQVMKVKSENILNATHLKEDQQHSKERVRERERNENKLKERKYIKSLTEKTKKR